MMWGGRGGWGGSLPPTRKNCPKVDNLRCEDKITKITPNKCPSQEVQTTLENFLKVIRHYTSMLKTNVCFDTYQAPKLWAMDLGNFKEKPMGLTIGHIKLHHILP
jgi:hypothetical protein